MEICEGSKKDGKEKLVTSENTGSAMWNREHSS